MLTPMENARRLMAKADRARREGRAEKAHRLGSQAVAQARRDQSPSALIEALKKLGQIQRDAGRADAGP